MLSKISVKKPMTVLVAVVLVLVLGIVSFFKMTPDLLPNMDFPYAVIMTTYAGQTPEAVEATVSKPLEQSMSAIDGVKEITSTSSDNYSLLMIEFEDGTNMDSATVDMRSSLDKIKGNWPDGVGTPYLIKINPNILPVAMTAVDFEGKSQTELSDYVTSELLNELEGIDGVASVSDKGIVTEQENVVLSQDKLDKLNKKISAALDNQFGDAEDKIAKAKKELQDNIGKAKALHRGTQLARCHLRAELADKRRCQRCIDALSRLDRTDYLEDLGFVRNSAERAVDETLAAGYTFLVIDIRFSVLI